MGRLGQLPDIVLGGIAPVSQAPDGPAGRLRGYEIEDRTGQLTSGLIRHVEGGGLGGFEGEFEPHRGAEAVTGPACEGHVDDGRHEVEAPERTGFLARRAGAIAGAGAAFSQETPRSLL